MTMRFNSQQGSTPGEDRRRVARVARALGETRGVWRLSDLMDPSNDGQNTVESPPAEQVRNAASPKLSNGPHLRTQVIDFKPVEREIVGWLLVLAGPQKNADFRIYSGANSIGAGADNDIVVTDQHLSSRHATIRHEDGRYFITDNNSTNGSYVGHKKITQYELIDNDTIRLGRTRIRIKCIF